MTFQQIYTECTDLRFNTQATKLAQVKKWVNAAEVALWNGRPWQFKRPAAVNMTVAVASGIATGTMPADFGRARRVWDPSGYELKYMDPEKWEGLYAVGSPPPGFPAAFTVIDRVAYIGPAQAGTFRLAYTRRYTKRNAGGTPTQGVMSVDTDTPYWDSEHHYLLVPLAIRVGKVLEDDPTAFALDQFLAGASDDVLSLVKSMEEELLVGVEDVVEQWGELWPSTL